MGNFFKNGNHVSTIPASELQERMSETQNASHWLEKLAEKGREKPFSEENAGVYWLCVCLIYLSCVFFIAAAWLPVYNHLNGYFSFLGFLSGTVATVLGLALLGAIEYFRFQNATAFFERYFIRQRFHGHLLAKGLFFTAVTAVLAWLAAPDTIALIIPAPSRPEVVLEKYDVLQSTLQPQIAEADHAAADFYKARTWQGKLDPVDGKRYVQLKAQSAKLRADLADGIRRIDERNAARNVEAATAFQQSLASAEAAKLKASRTVILAIIFFEIIFWACFGFKERYEAFCLFEAKMSGHLPDNKPTGDRPKQSGQPPRDFRVIQGDGLRPANGNPALSNEIHPPSVIQPEQPRVLSIGESLNELLTYWSRAVSYEINGDPARMKTAMVEVRGRAGQMLDKHGFQFFTVGQMMFVGDPRPAAKREEREREGRVVGTILPERDFLAAVEAARAKLNEAKSQPVELESKSAAA